MDSVKTAQLALGGCTLKNTWGSRWGRLMVEIKDFHSCRHGRFLYYVFEGHSLDMYKCNMVPLLPEYEYMPVYCTINISQLWEKF